jgi:hypothetical protein
VPCIRSSPIHVCHALPRYNKLTCQLELQPHLRLDRSAAWQLKQIVGARLLLICHLLRHLISELALLTLMCRVSITICIHGHASLKISTYTSGIALVLTICFISIPSMAAQACVFPALEQGRSRLAAASLPSGLVFFAGGSTGEEECLPCRL